MFNFVPRVYFYGNVLGPTLVTEYIEGKVYQSFKQMCQSKKNACLDCVSKLHKSNILHGDLRAPNFIVQSKNNVFVIDFGRSKIIEEDTKRELDAEMKYFKRLLNGYEDD